MRRPKVLDLIVNEDDIPGDHRQHTILYGIIGPDDDEIRYVGQTTNYRRRFEHHVAGSGSRPINRWLRWLKDTGRHPRFVILAVLKTTKHSICSPLCLGLALERECLRRMDDSLNMRLLTP